MQEPINPIVTSQNSVLVKKSKLILVVGLILVVLVCFGLIIFKSISVSNTNSDEKNTTPTSITTNTIQASSTPKLTSIITPTKGTSTIKSISFNYSFQYPTNLTLIELQGGPMSIEPETQVTSEGGYLRPENFKYELGWEFDSKPLTSYTTNETLKVGNKTIPLQVTKIDGIVYYHFEDTDTHFGIDIKDITRISFYITASENENLAEAKQALTQMLQTLIATK